MHLNILSDKQCELLDTVRQFNRTFFLVGGTAIALHIGHRRSIDFDLFTRGGISKHRIKTKLKDNPIPKRIIYEDADQLHYIINQVKLTFFSYPYDIEHPIKVDTFITMPSLLTLAAMKAYALGRRAKWKDYVDMFFILKDHHSITEICAKAESVFKDQFSSKMFRQQLAFHDDIDYTEEVDYLVDNVEPSTIKRLLIDKATEIKLN